MSKYKSLIIVSIVALSVIITGIIIDGYLLSVNKDYLFYRYEKGSTSFKFGYILKIMEAARSKDEVARINNYLVLETNTPFLVAADKAFRMISKGDDRYRPSMEAVLLGSKDANWRRRHMLNYPLFNYPSTNTKYWLKIIAGRSDDELKDTALSCLESWKFNEQNIGGIRVQKNLVMENPTETNAENEVKGNGQRINRK